MSSTVKTRIVNRKTFGFNSHSGDFEGDSRNTIKECWQQASAERMTDALNKLEIGKALNGDRMKFLDKAAITGVDFWVLSSIWYEHQLIAVIVVAEEEEEEEEEIVVAE